MQLLPETAVDYAVILLQHASRRQLNPQRPPGRSIAKTQCYVQIGSQQSSDFRRRHVVLLQLLQGVLHSQRGCKDRMVARGLPLLLVPMVCGVVD